MKRGPTGEYRIAMVGGEEVRAFVPHPLPPKPPLDLSGARTRLLELATLALARLDRITLLLPDIDVFLYAHPAVAKSLEALTRLGIVREVNGKQRNRIFAYDRYLRALGEGMGAL